MARLTREQAKEFHEQAVRIFRDFASSAGWTVGKTSGRFKASGSLTIRVEFRAPGSEESLRLDTNRYSKLGFKIGEHVYLYGKPLVHYEIIEFKRTGNAILKEIGGTDKLYRANPKALVRVT